jgi:hypothetical protein
MIKINAGMPAGPTRRDMGRKIQPHKMNAQTQSGGQTPAALTEIYS